MKRTKKFFALLLALTLALGASVLAAAEEPAEEPDAATAAPALIAEAAALEAADAWLNVDTLSITYGKNFTLNAEGLIPEEYAGWEVSYQWSEDGQYVLVPQGVFKYGSEPVLHLSSKNAEYPGKKFLGMFFWPAVCHYYCYAIVRNAAGDEVVLPLYRAEVTVNPTFFVNAVHSVLGVLINIITTPVILVLAPLFMLADRFFS